MAGGTVTIVGGNVIHTFTSSGYLTPIKLVNNSLRFRSSASAYLGRTPAVASNRRTWTWSGWVKRGKLTSGTQSIFTGYWANTDNGYFNIAFRSGDDLAIQTWNIDVRITTQLFRDPSAWYHIVVAVDTTQASNTDRVKLYVNGVQVTAFASTGTITQNTDLAVNYNGTHYIGSLTTSTGLLDGYQTECHLIDGQALTPNSFGTFNSLGVWQPITYGGSYGTNGFYLPFTNNASTTTLGYDFSPNGNNWTTNNISVTAGVTYDSMTDVPTLTSATAANYAVLNPLNSYGTASYSPALANLYYNINVAAWAAVTSTIGMSSGKYYFEFVSSNVSQTSVGIANISNSYIGVNVYVGQSSTSYGYTNGGLKYNNASPVSYGATYTSNDIIGVAFDADAGTLTFYKNNVSQGVAFSSIPSGTYCFAISLNNCAGFANFGQQPFTYTPPSGFVALNTYNL
jgi:hypothetical protein